jgi:hypothetical protein
VVRPKIDTMAHVGPELLSAVRWLLPVVCCLLSAVCYLLAAVCCLLSAVCLLLAACCWLLAAGCWSLSLVSYLFTVLYTSTPWRTSVDLLSTVCCLSAACLLSVVRCLLSTVCCLPVLICNLLSPVSFAAVHDRHEGAHRFDLISPHTRVFHTLDLLHFCPQIKRFNHKYLNLCELKKPIYQVVSSRVSLPVPSCAHPSASSPRHACSKGPSAVCCVPLCCLLPAICCLVSTVLCLLSCVYCLLSAVWCLLSAVCCHMSAVCSVLCAFSCARRST